MNPFRMARTAAPAAAICLLAGCASGPARTDATFAHVAPGMSESDVAQMLGRPDETMRFPLSNNVAWDYRYYDTWGYLAIYSVTFGPDRRVVSTISNRINSGGDHAGH